MSTKNISDQELAALKEDGWKIHIIGVKKEEGQNNHLEQAKLGVVKSGGKIVENLAVINGFTAIFPPGSIEIFNTTSADHIAFSEEDKEVKISK
ncbi:hypothetical protein HI914_03787 [Erysiphe necator]|uniref:Uncharacterized protein n=1 Tax=Uncinula necator TaxID=52586 RepID=A0A0B1P024_UNCNE|nr:hypothetical protein HI914_03787 [Erysiphe necator]KHJ31588.1 putative proteinase inhibitor propeptide [Erysiphe necator]